MVTPMNREWLEELGYSGLDEHTAASLIQAAHEALELRVGQVLTEGLEDWQTDEFTTLVDGDVEVARAWTIHCGIDPSADPHYHHLVEESGPDLAAEEVLCEWAKLTWLRRNAPDYRVVVQRCFENLEQELRDARTGILPVLR